MLPNNQRAKNSREQQNSWTTRNHLPANLPPHPQLPAVVSWTVSPLPCWRGCAAVMYMMVHECIPLPLTQVRQKEVARATATMTRSPEEEKQLEMCARLPEFCRILRMYPPSSTTFSPPFSSPSSSSHAWFLLPMLSRAPILDCFLQFLCCREEGSDNLGHGCSEVVRKPLIRTCTKYAQKLVPLAYSFIPLLQAVWRSTFSCCSLSSQSGQQKCRRRRRFTSR